MKDQLLKAVYQHPGFSSEDVQRIISAHDRRRLPKGESLLSQGSVAHEYVIVEEGLLRSFVISHEGDDVTTDFVCAGDIAIEVLSLFQRVPTLENIVALTDCWIWAIPFDAFQELYHGIPSFNEWGRAWVAGNLFYQKQRSLSMITMSATERYLKLLKDKPEVLQQAPLKNIASYLGVTDTSLSRIRKEVAEKHP